jgi:hypothetical protein
MSKLIYVDNSNVLIEGQRLSAVVNGKAESFCQATKSRILDCSYRLDFGKLHQFVADGDPTKISQTMLFGTKPPKYDSLWKLAKRA